MIPADAPIIKIGDQQLIARFTIPRLRELNLRTGKTTAEIMREVVGLSFDAIMWMFWAAVAHPGNKEYANTPPPSALGSVASPLEQLVQPENTQAIINGITEAFKVAFPPAAVPANPPNPTVQ